MNQDMTAYVVRLADGLKTVKKLEVKHDPFPENEILTNAVWCDIGGHKVHEDEMRFSEDAAVCSECYSHYTE